MRSSKNSRPSRSWTSGAGWARDADATQKNASAAGMPRRTLMEADLFDESIDARLTRPYN
jgi:hypothetical protein